MKKLYFVDVEAALLFSLSGSKAKQLVKKYPNWKDYEAGRPELNEVFELFKQHGTLLGTVDNIFVGFTN